MPWTQHTCWIWNGGGDSLYHAFIFEKYEGPLEVPITNARKDNLSLCGKAKSESPETKTIGAPYCLECIEIQKRRYEDEMATIKASFEYQIDSGGCGPRKRTQWLNRQLEELERMKTTLRFTKAVFR